MAASCRVRVTGDPYVNGCTRGMAGTPVTQLLKVIAAYGLIQGMTSDLVCTLLARHLVCFLLRQ